MKWNGEIEDHWLDRYSKGLKCWAYLPRQMNCGTWVWWEHYWSGLHRGVNNRKWWVNALKREDCLQTHPKRPPPPKPQR